MLNVSGVRSANFFTPVAPMGRIYRGIFGGRRRRDDAIDHAGIAAAIAAALARGLIPLARDVVRPERVRGIATVRQHLCLPNLAIGTFCDPTSDLAELFAFTLASVRVVGMEIIGRANVYAPPRCPACGAVPSRSRHGCLDVECPYRLP